MSLPCLLAIPKKSIVNENQYFTEQTLFSAHCTRNFLPTRLIPFVDMFWNALSASSFKAKATYPTPLDRPVPCSVTTKADLTGAISENKVCKSIEVVVYGRFETKIVDLL